MSNAKAASGRWRSCVVVATLLVAAPACDRTTDPPSVQNESQQSIAHLLRLMRERLVLMHDVARSKWNAKKPIADAAREKALLDELQAQGRAHGLTAEYTREFFAAQIKASRMLQEVDFARWKSERQGLFADVPDLIAELRPKIDRLNQSLLAALAAAQPCLDSEEGHEFLRQERILTGDGITVRIGALAREPLERRRPDR